jgi:PBP superfamily domain
MMLPSVDGSGASQASAPPNVRLASSAGARADECIGISSQSAAVSAGLGEADLQNQAGAFVQPTPTTVGAAVTAGSANIPENLAAPLIYEPGAQSYPIVNFEYIIVKSNQPDANVAMAIRSFCLSPSTAPGEVPRNIWQKNNFKPCPRWSCQRSRTPSPRSVARASMTGRHQRHRLNWMGPSSVDRRPQNGATPPQPTSRATLQDKVPGHSPRDAGANGSTPEPTPRYRL